RRRSSPLFPYTPLFRSFPSPLRRDEQGRVRVIAGVTSFGAALDAAFDEIRQHARGSASVLIRLADTLQAISRKLCRPADRDAVRSEEHTSELQSRENLV